MRTISAASTKASIAAIRVSVVLFCHVDDDEQRARDMVAHGLSGRYRQDFDHMIDAFCAAGSTETVAERTKQFLDAGADDVLFLPQVETSGFAEQVERLQRAVSVVRKQRQRD